jgi:hypothetical protein
LSGRRIKLRLVIEQDSRLKSPRQHLSGV